MYFVIQSAFNSKLFTHLGKYVDWIFAFFDKVLVHCYCCLSFCVKPVSPNTFYVDAPFYHLAPYF